MKWLHDVTIISFSSNLFLRHDASAWSDIRRAKIGNNSQWGVGGREKKWDWYVHLSTPISQSSPPSWPSHCVNKARNIISRCAANGYRDACENYHEMHRFTVAHMRSPGSDNTTLFRFVKCFCFGKLPNSIPVWKYESTPSMHEWKLSGGSTSLKKSSVH